MYEANPLHNNDSILKLHELKKRFFQLNKVINTPILKLVLIKKLKAVQWVEKVHSPDYDGANTVLIYIQQYLFSTGMKTLQLC